MCLLVQRHVRGRDHVLSLRAEALGDAVAWMTQYREFWEQRLAALEAFVLAGDPEAGDGEADAAAPQSSPDDAPSGAAR